MIVDPNFLDNYKVKSLSIDLDSDLAPLCLIRLWGYCQLQKCWVFPDMTPKKLRQICQFAGSDELFFTVMMDCGFIEETENGVIICGWEERNSSLINAWNNGKKGGRPKSRKKPRFSSS